MTELTQRRPRPYIPLAVREKVAQRQWIAVYGTAPDLTHMPLRQRISHMLNYLGIFSPQLDHDPALVLRKLNKRSGKYTPDANDPAFLVYRKKAEHQQKTTGRKADAEKTVTTKGSDIWLKSKFNRLEGKIKPKRKRPIPQRKKPWPKGRGFQK